MNEYSIGIEKRAMLIYIPKHPSSRNTELALEMPAGRIPHWPLPTLAAVCTVAKSDLQFESVKKRAEVGGVEVAAMTTMTRLFRSNKMSARGASLNAMALQALQAHDYEKVEMVI